MDKRKRVLIVEDIKTQLESLKDHFKFEGFRVEGVSNVDDAIKAIDEITFNVAIVDIMLAGNDDDTNRDGVKVLEYLNKLGEGTRTIVLTNQPEMQLVSDFHKNYSIYDFIHKKEKLAIEGMNVLFKSVNNATKLFKNDFDEWGVLANLLAFPMSEAEFFDKCKQTFKFNGGFDFFSRIIRRVCKHLVPLINVNNPNDRFHIDSDLECLMGKYWSKGQGIPIQMYFTSKTSKLTKEKDYFFLKDKDLFYQYEKSGFVVFVEKLRGHNISFFGVSDQ